MNLQHFSNHLQITQPFDRFKAFPITFCPRHGRWTRLRHVTMVMRNPQLGLLPLCGDISCAKSWNKSVNLGDYVLGSLNLLENLQSELLAKIPQKLTKSRKFGQIVDLTFQIGCETLKWIISLQLANGCVVPLLTFSWKGMQLKGDASWDLCNQRQVCPLWAAAGTLLSVEDDQAQLKEQLRALQALLSFDELVLCLRHYYWSTVRVPQIASRYQSDIPKESLSVFSMGQSQVSQSSWTALRELYQMGTAMYHQKYVAGAQKHGAMYFSWPWIAIKLTNQEKPLAN